MCVCVRVCVRVCDASIYTHIYDAPAHLWSFVFRALAYPAEPFVVGSGLILAIARARSPRRARHATFDGHTDVVSLTLVEPPPECDIDARDFRQLTRRRRGSEI